MSSVFNTKNKDYTTKTKMFLDDSATSVARYDMLKYPQFDILTERQLSFFWKPDEVNLYSDAKDFKSLSDHERHIFTSNLKRQILLDSVQGRAPALCFAPIATLPELENWIVTWTFSETIHSKSYTHIIRNLYNNPSEIFDEILNIEEIVDCAKDISKYYDNLDKWNTRKNWINQNDPDHWNAEQNKKTFNYEHKKALWLALNAVNALEGVRFYVSFICSWAFAEMKKMEGNAKIIKLICRDENLHLASTQKILQLLPQDDTDFVKIKEECKSEVLKMFVDVVNQEEAWADYLFKDGSMLGLTPTVLKQYVRHIARKRMKAIDIDDGGIYNEYKKNPFPWADKWIAGQDVQVAPQETDKSEYTIGEVNNDISDESFKNFTL